MSEINYLYIHVPFCISKCSYCDFYSLPLGSVSQDVFSEYVKALCAEINQKKEYLKYLKTIYIGGGTPSILPTKEISNLIESINKISLFDKDIEITIEVNPNSVDHEKLKDYLSLGINRLSIGVQSFCNDELSILGRIHNEAEAEQAIELSRKAGFKNISLDLIYGIPNKDSDIDLNRIKNWQYSLKKALKFCPEHLSLYELTYEEGTKITNAIKNKGLFAPNEEVIKEMYYLGIDILKQHGYRQYEISNFSKEGFQCLHNLNYWDRGEYIGIGAGAHSFFDKKRSANFSDILLYIEKIRNNEVPIVEEIVLNKEEEIKELVFLGLRKTKGIEVSKLYDKNLMDLLDGILSELISQGLLEIKDGYLRLTRKGLILSNEVIVRILLGIEKSHPEQLVKEYPDSFLF